MPLPYAPKHSIASEEEMNTIEKQKLQHKYTFWAMIREQNYKNKDNFDENKLVEIESCDTVQDFWMVYQHLRRPTAMPYGTFLHVFKDGIRPVWEDP